MGGVRSNGAQRAEPRDEDGARGWQVKETHRVRVMCCHADVPCAADAPHKQNLTSVNVCVHRREYVAKARVVRATERRLKQLNKEITELIRQILELEEKYQINSKREVEAKMKEAVQTNDPELLEQVFKPSKEVR